MKPKGVALIITLGLLLVLAVFAVGTFSTTRIETLLTRNDTTSTQANYVAQVGIQKYKTIAFQSFRFYLENIDQYTSLATFSRCGNLLASGLDTNRDFLFNNADFRPGDTRTEWVDPNDQSKGRYSVTLNISGPYLILRSVGEAGGARSTVNVVAFVENSGIFSNAIAAGKNASGTINGTAEVWGSVYVRGDDAEPNQNAINSNGGFNLHNFYTRNNLRDITNNQLTDAQLETLLKLEALEQPDLCAAIRVYRGRIALSGTATIGDSALPSGVSANDGWEHRVAGVFVDGGTTASSSCNNSTADICTAGNNQIFSEMQPAAYDLSRPMEIPTLDEANGCKNGGTWRNCLGTLASSSGLVFTAGIQGSNATFSTNPNMSCSGITGSGGALTLVGSGQNQVPTLTFNQGNISCFSSNPDRGFRYTYNSGTDTGSLEVYGVTNFEGMDLVFAKTVDVRYTNKATLFVETASGRGGNVRIRGDVLPTSSFPDTDVLGIVAENRLSFSGESQGNGDGSNTARQIAMGLFYAGTEAILEGNGNNLSVFGTVATPGRVCMSANCNGGGQAKIVQVPGLEYNLAPGFNLMSNSSLATFGQLTYERR